MITLNELFPGVEFKDGEFNFLDLEEPPKAQEAHDLMVANGWTLHYHDYSTDCDSDGQFMEVTVDSFYIHLTEGKVVMHHSMKLVLESAFHADACDSVVETIFHI